MKHITIFCFLSMATLTLARPQLYDEKYDDIHLEKVLADRSLLITFLDCLLDKGPCTKQYAGIKGFIREALENECAKCTAMQKSNIYAVMDHLINVEPELWDQLMAMYDTNGKYAPIFEKKYKKTTKMGVKV